MLFARMQKPVFAAITFSFTSSFTHIVFIAIQRVIAVAFPLKVKHMITKTRCYIALAVLWIASALPVFVIAQINIVSGLTSLAYTGIITETALTFVYSIICFKTFRRDITNDFRDETQRRRQKSDREVLLYSVAITVAFIICNFPLSIQGFLGYRVHYHFAYAFHALYSLNPFLDTLLYFLWSYYKRRRQAVVNHNSRGAIITSKNNVFPINHSSQGDIILSKNNAFLRNHTSQVDIIPSKNNKLLRNHISPGDIIPRKDNALLINHTFPGAFILGNNKKYIINHTSQAVKVQIGSIESTIESTTRV